MWRLAHLLLERCREREVMLMGNKRWTKVLRLAVKVLVIVAIIVVMALLLAPKAC